MLKDWLQKRLKPRRWTGIKDGLQRILTGILLPAERTTRALESEGDFTTSFTNSFQRLGGDGEIEINVFLVATVGSH